MHYRSLLALSFLFAVSTVRAQQPIPPPDTVFPLGGLTTGGLFGDLNRNDTIVRQQLPNFGLNMEFNGPQPAGLNPGQASVVGPGGIGDCLNALFFSAGTNASGSSPGWAPLFTEWDFDLVSNESSDGGAVWNPAWDLVYSGWKPNLGIPTSTNAGAEWKIAPGGSPAGTDYLDAGSNNNSLTVPIGSPSDFLGGAGILYLDFVSRIEPSQYQPIMNQPGTTIYDLSSSAQVLEQQSTDGGVTWTTRTTNLSGATLPTSNIFPVNQSCGDASCPTCICITLGDYGNAKDHSQQGYYNPDYASTHFGNDYSTELDNILTYPNPNDPGVSQSQNYSVFRIKFDIAGAGYDLNQTLPDKTIIRTIVSSINFSLIGTSNSQGIFVRGVRVRTDWADDLYRNKFLTSSTAPDRNTLGLYDDKNQINVPIDQGLEGQQGADVGLFQHLKSDMGNNWQYATLLDVGNECNWPAWRTFAYLNEALRKWSSLPANGGRQMNLTTIVANTGASLQMWRSIYEDQSYTLKNGVAPPPPLQDEAIVLGINHMHEINYGYRDDLPGSQPHDFTHLNPLFAGDAIPSAIKNHPQFLELGRVITGWNGQTGSNSAYGATPTSAVMSGINQGDDYPTYTSTMQAELSVVSGVNQISAESSYPQTQFPVPGSSSSWTPFYGYASAWEGVRGDPPTYSPQSFDGESLQQTLLSSIERSQPTLKRSSVAWLLPYSDLDNATALATLNHQLEPSYQPSTSWEIREQTWDCLTWGAKGIIYNPMGSDGLLNMGFCGNNFENTPNCGFSYLSDGVTPFPNGDLITAPPGNITMPWTSGSSYSVGQWVIDKTSNNCGDQTPWVCVSDVSGTLDPCGDAQHWAKSNTYCYYGNVNLTPASGYLIPPATTTSNSSDNTWPDHLIGEGHFDPTCSCIKIYNGAVMWIPCITDFDIIDQNQNTIMSSSHNDPVVADALPNEGGVTGIEAYLCAVTGAKDRHGNGWSSTLGSNNNFVPDDLRNYYLTMLNNSAPSAWLPVKLSGNSVVSIPMTDPDPDNQPGTGHTPISNWIAADRDLDIEYDQSSGPHRTGHANWQKYDYWGFIPFQYPSGSITLALTGVPTYYGVKDRSDGVKRSMADIAPIAWELKNLKWVTSYDYSDLNSPDTNAKAWASGFNGDNSKHLDGPHQTGDPEFPFYMLDSWLVFPNARLGDMSSQNQSYNLGAVYPNLPFLKSTTIDPDNSSMLYNIGVFHDPNDPDALYTTIANRRTWPMIVNDTVISGVNQTLIRTVDNTTQTPINYLGAIDARQLDLQLKNSPDASGFMWYDFQGRGTNWPSTNIDWIKITNLRSGTDVIQPFASVKAFSIDFEPGEGTLLRLAPATALEPGRTNYAGMAYNNGHRMAELSGGDHGMVWEQNGTIMFCAVKGTDPMGTFSTQSQYTPQVVYPPAGSSLPANAHNPSIAAKPDGTVGIVFSIDDFQTGTNGHGNGQFERSVVMVKSLPPYTSWYTTPCSGDFCPAWMYADPICQNCLGLPYVTPYVNDVTGNLQNGAYTNLLVPVITPAYDGFIVAFALPNNILAYHIPSNSTPYEISGTPSDLHSDHQMRMCSIATKNETFDETTINPNIHDPAADERIYFAWEEDHEDGTSEIKFTYMDHCITTGVQIYHSNSSTYVDDDPMYMCKNYHPMIAVENLPTTGGPSVPAVVWEAPADVRFNENHSVLRELIQWNNGNSVWSGLTSFVPFSNDVENLPQPQFRFENFFCSGQPQNSFEKEVIYQDTFAHEQFISRFDQNSNDWTRNTKLKGYAQFGSVSLPYICESSDPGFLTFRGIVPDQQGLYAANMNVTPLTPANPSADIPASIELIKNFSARPKQGYSLCATELITIRIAPPYLTMNSEAPPQMTSGKFPWVNSSLGIFQAAPIDDTENILEQASWPQTEDSMRTIYFPATVTDTVSIGRVLVVDTTQIPSLLPDQTHFMSYKLVVKDSASQTITQVLDSAIIHGQSAGGGFGSYPGTNPSDTTMNGEGYNIHSPILPTPSGSAYISVIITKDSATQAELVQDQEYTDTLLFPQPPDTSDGGGGEKKASPYSQNSDGSQLTVTVHPNPVKGTVKICVADIPGGIPTQVDVVDQLGHEVAMLFNATPEAESGLCLSLDCSTISSGTYYADLQTMGMHKAVKFTIEH